MALRQLYYTSCRNQVTNQTGFQIKAESPGIPTSVRDPLNRLLGYRIPPSLVNQPVVTHPISLRYYWFNTQEAALICSQSNGTDEFGRPGNYFAHAVIGERNKLAYPLPPITFWKSPFWVTKHDSQATQIPTSEKFDAEVRFDYDAVVELYKYLFTT